MNTTITDNDKNWTSTRLPVETKEQG
jgi:hypothetical protein